MSKLLFVCDSCCAGSQSHPWFHHVEPVFSPFMSKGLIKTRIMSSVLLSQESVAIKSFPPWFTEKFSWYLKTNTFFHKNQILSPSTGKDCNCSVHRYSYFQHIVIFNISAFLVYFSTGFHLFVSLLVLVGRGWAERSCSAGICQQTGPSQCLSDHRSHRQTRST